MSRYPKIDSLIPLSIVDTLILSVLRDGAAHGYRVMKEVRERAGNKISVGTTIIYRSLKRMSGSGLVEQFDDLHDTRRKYYRITTRGAEALNRQAVWTKFMSGILDRKTLIRLPRVFLNQALSAMITPHVVRGNTQSSIVLAEDENDEGYTISLMVQQRINGDWHVMVTTSPPMEGRLALVFGETTFSSPFDGQGCASNDVPSTLLTAPDGPDLVVGIQPFEYGQTSIAHTDEPPPPPPPLQANGAPGGNGGGH